MGTRICESSHLGIRAGTLRERVRRSAVASLRRANADVRWADLLQMVWRENPGATKNQISGALHHFRNNLPVGVERPARGVYHFRGPLRELSISAPSEGDISLKRNRK